MARKLLLTSVLWWAAGSITAPPDTLWAGAGPVPMYERLIEPLALGERDRHLLQEIQAWGRQRGRPLRYDARLSRVALVLLPLAPGTRPDLEAAARSAQRWGCTDGQLAAVSLRAANKKKALRQVLAHQLRVELAQVEANRFGLASRVEAGDAVVVVLFSRHLVNLVPFVSRVERPRALTLAGSLPRGQAAEGLVWVVGRADGTTEKIALQRHGRAFRGVLQLVAADQGQVLTTQVMIDRGKGPEIAATFALGVGTAPWPQSKDDSLLPRPQPAEDPVAQLIRLILGLRQSQDLPLPAQSSRLAEVARSHARDMRDHGFFAHRSPTHGDVTDRLRRRGIPFTRALENIAAVTDVREAMTNWWQSPSHRANLLDPEIGAFGVGVAPGPRGQIFAVLVLAHLADDGSANELASRAESHLLECRRRRGHPALVGDRRLRRLAARHSRQMAGIGRLSDSSPTHGRLVDTVFRELAVSQAAADVYAADSIEAVIEAAAQSPHLAGHYQRFAVGVSRLPGSEGPQVWVTVIYAAN